MEYGVALIKIDCLEFVGGVTLSRLTNHPAASDFPIQNRRCPHVSTFPYQSNRCYFHCFALLRIFQTTERNSRHFGLDVMVQVPEERLQVISLHFLAFVDADLMTL